MLKKDNFRMGIVLGLLAPLLGMGLYYCFKFYPTYTLKDFFTLLLLQKSLITGIVSLSLLANAVIFTLYINTHRDRTAKGIFAATCMYAIVAILVKYFL